MPEETKNQTGYITWTIASFLREVQSWYQGHGGHLLPSASDQGTGANITRIASRFKHIASIRLADVAEAHQLASRQEEDLHLVVQVSGEYLGLRAFLRDGRSVGASITRLSNDGETLLRVNTENERVSTLLNLRAMNSPLVDTAALLGWIESGPPYHLTEAPDQPPLCFVDLQDECTLQMYATVRRALGFIEQPVIVDCLLQGFYALARSNRRAICLARANFFELQTAAFLLNGEIGTHSLTTRLKNESDRGLIALLGSSSKVSHELNEVVNRNLRTILARVDRLPA